MFGEIWAEFSSWDFLSQLLVSLVVVAPIAPYLYLVLRRMMKRSEATLASWSDYVQTQDDKEADRAAALAWENTPVQDWCPKCENIHLRKRMVWDADGRWVCRYCAAGVDQPSVQITPMMQDVIDAATGDKTGRDWAPWGTGEKAR